MISKHHKYRNQEIGYYGNLLMLKDTYTISTFIQGGAWGLGKGI